MFDFLQTNTPKQKTEVRKATLQDITVNKRSTRIDSIRSNYLQEEEMPTHCCVPECTKKCYRIDDGTKESYF